MKYYFLFIVMIINLLLIKCNKVKYQVFNTNKVKIIELEIKDKKDIINIKMEILNTSLDTLWICKSNYFKFNNRINDNYYDIIVNKNAKKAEIRKTRFKMPPKTYTDDILNYYVRIFPNNKINYNLDIQFPLKQRMIGLYGDGIEYNKKNIKIINILIGYYVEMDKKYHKYFKVNNNMIIINNNYVGIMKEDTIKINITK